jgi:glutamate synthase domain-containing protein 1
MPAASAWSPRWTARSAARHGAGRHRCAEGGLASRRGGCRWQDRRRRRHSYRNPAGFLRRRDRARRRRLRDGPIAVGMVFLPKTDFGAQERCRQIVETEILNFGYRSMAGARCRSMSDVHRREGQRDAAGDRTDHDLERARRLGGSEVRARFLHHPPQDRESGDRGADPELYICSLSCRSIIYKGMFLAEQA